MKEFIKEKLLKKLIKFDENILQCTYECCDVKKGHKYAILFQKVSNDSSTAIAYIQKGKIGYKYEDSKRYIAKVEVEDVGVYSKINNLFFSDYLMLSNDFLEELKTIIKSCKLNYFKALASLPCQYKEIAQSLVTYLMG